jgi:hypothetical protein
MGEQRVGWLVSVPYGQAGGKALAQRHGLLEPLNDVVGVVQRRLRQQHHELLAAVAGEDVTLA